MQNSSLEQLQMGEFALLNSIYEASKELGEHVSIGPGDDMGEIIVGNQRILLAVDQLIVGRHVELDETPENIGRKAIARSFSDIAAMCGTPICSLMTACMPTDTDDDWAMRVFSSAKAHAERWNGPIIGGDIATSQRGPAMFTVTVMAKPSTLGAVSRCGAQVGDVVCVTGEIGNSIASHHITFEPRITLAQDIQQALGSDLHSMIDISDGLAQDASHLTNDECSIQLNTETIPLREGASPDTALSDGEDYELLFTCATPPDVDDVTVIGTVVPRASASVVNENGDDVSMKGWEHT